MIIKSILRMKEILAVILIILVLLGITIPGMLRLVGVNQVEVLSYYAEQTKPHIVDELDLSNFTFFAQQLNLPESTAETLPGRVEIAMRVAETLGEEWFQYAKSSPLLQCAGAYATINNAFMVFAPSTGILVPLPKTNITDEERDLIGQYLLSLTKVWPSTEGRPTPPPIPSAEELYNRIPPDLRESLPKHLDFPLLRDHPEYAQYFGQFVSLAWLRDDESRHYASIFFEEYIQLTVVRDASSLKCIVSTIPGEADFHGGDGIVDIMINEGIARLLGVQNGTTITVGSIHLRLWPVLLSQKVQLLTTQDEVSDLYKSLMNSSSVGEEYAPVMALSIALKGQRAAGITIDYNASDRLLKSLAEMSERSKAILVPSGSLVALYNPELARSILESYFSARSMPEGFYLPIHPGIMGDYNARYIASSTPDEISRVLEDSAATLAESLEHGLAKVYRTCTPNYEVNYASGVYMVSTEAGEYTFTTHNIMISFWMTPEEQASKKCWGIISGSNGYDQIFSLIDWKLNPTERSPMGVVALISLIPSVLLLGWVMTGEGLEIIIGVLRRWVAVASARGASQSHMVRDLTILLIILGLISSLIGLVIAGVIVDGYFQDLGAVRGVKAILSDKVATISTPTLVVITSYLVARFRAKALREVQPVEAVRVQLSIKRAFPSRVGRAGVLLIALSLISLTLGILRPSPEEMSRLTSSGTLELIIIIVAIGILFTPFTPLIMLYESSKLTAYSGVIKRAGVWLAKKAARGALGGLAWSSGSRLYDAFTSSLRAGVLGLGMITGLALSASGILHSIIPWLQDKIIVEAAFGRTPYSLLLTAADAYGLASILIFSAVVALVVTSLILYSSISALFSLIRREVVIMRARGASRRDALKYVYLSFLPSIVVVIVGGVLVGLILLLSLDSAVGVSLIDMWSEPTPHLVPSPDPLSIGIVSVSIGVVLLVPALASFKVVGRGDLARLLREEV